MCDRYEQLRERLLRLRSLNDQAEGHMGEVMASVIETIAMEGFDVAAERFGLEVAQGMAELAAVSVYSQLEMQRVESTVHDDGAWR